ncbi:MAG: NYN domain-containing protein [Alphaproteobacteria bacterium]|nr:NYN domain-containing protein [Alphaproteobacteria bacterium]MDP6257376.1 NYN domain-containing protein [Alphaproteobacteria bacterium]MDP7055311.1 NYN domain-containing protein [Alphaproteobacteria bacterium]MDP7229068.1 NYN domain-containing protein [Alphaproteobacteria bacterium]MDP7459723.1 NYN domain-containing protein [Alphaproteobacteria bacterium]
MMNQPHERIALFIDGSNLYAAARALGFDIDYKKLLEFFTGRGYMVRALYYTALIEDQEYSPIRPLVDWLDYNGYTMVTKPTKEFTDATGRRKIKGNMDIELAVDMLEMADTLDHLYVFSGDGDFRRLVEAVQRKGKRVTVVSTVRSSPPMAADELRRQADVFLELEKLIPQISRAGNRQPVAAGKLAEPKPSPLSDDEDANYADDAYGDYDDHYADYDDDESKSA